jgi:hypothetical protein
VGLIALHNLMMNYVETFICVARDTKAQVGKEPPLKEGAPSVARLQFDLLKSRSYKLTQEEILFEVHVRRLGLSPAEIKKRRTLLWKEFFSKSQACLRASPLPKTYGWGIHFDAQGRAALHAVDSLEYHRFASGRAGSPQLLYAMSSKRLPANADKT